MTTKFNLPMLPGKAGQWLRVNPTETGYIWDVGAPPPGGGYFYVAEDGFNSPQESVINFINFFCHKFWHNSYVRLRWIELFNAFNCFWLDEIKRILRATERYQAFWRCKHSHIREISEQKIRKFFYFSKNIILLKSLSIFSFDICCVHILLLTIL